MASSHVAANRSEHRESRALHSTSQHKHGLCSNIVSDQTPAQHILVSPSSHAASSDRDSTSRLGRVFCRFQRATRGTEQQSDSTRTAGKSITVVPVVASPNDEPPQNDQEAPAQSPMAVPQQPQPTHFRPLRLEACTSLPGGAVPFNALVPPSLEANIPAEDESWKMISLNPPGRPIGDDASSDCTITVEDGAAALVWKLDRIILAAGQDLDDIFKGTIDTGAVASVLSERKARLIAPEAFSDGYPPRSGKVLTALDVEGVKVHGPINVRFRVLNSNSRYRFSHPFYVLPPHFKQLEWDAMLSLKLVKEMGLVEVADQSLGRAI